MSRFKLIWVKNEMVSVGEVGGDSWYSGKVNFVAYVLSCIQRQCYS